MGVATTNIAGRTYAIVGALVDDGIQIIDVSDPNNPVAVARLGDGGNTELDGAGHLSAFKMNGRTYAFVGVSSGDGIQLIDITVPYNPIPTINLMVEDDVTLMLDGAREPKIFKVDGRTYALVSAFTDDGIQIVRLLTETERPPAFVSAAYNLTTSTISVTFDKDINWNAADYSLLHIRDIYQNDGGVTLAGSTSKTTADRTLTAILNDATAMTVNAMVEPQLDIDAGAVTDTDGNLIEAAPDQLIDTIRPDFVIYPISSLADGEATALDGPLDVAHFDVDGSHYAIVTANLEDGIQIVNVTDPYSPYPVAALYDNATLTLDNPASVDAFQVDGRTYAAVKASTADSDGAPSR